MSFDTTIDLGEIGEQDITVCFDYTRGLPGSFNEPPKPEEVSITYVQFRGIDIKPDLCREMITELEQEAFEHMASVRWQQDEDRAESSYFDKEAA